MSLGCSVMPNSRLKIVGDEFLTSFDYDHEFHVNSLFDRSIYRPMCTDMGNVGNLAVREYLQSCLLPPTFHFLFLTRQTAIVFDQTNGNSLLPFG